MRNEKLKQQIVWLRVGQWDRIRPLIQRDSRLGGKTGGDSRMFVEAVLYHIRTGTPWRELPREYGEWNNLYVRFKRWYERDIWHDVCQELALDPDFRDAHLSNTVLEFHRKSAKLGNHATSLVLSILEKQVLASLLLTGG